MRIRVKDHMPKVTFISQQTDPVTVEARSGETLLDLAIQHDIPLQHACGGFCACTTCHVKVRETGPAGPAALSPVGEDEADRMEYLDEREVCSRLGCQAAVLADVTVEIVNVLA